MDNNSPRFGWNFDNTYARLSEVFFQTVNPASAPTPKTLLFNKELAQSLGLEAEALAHQAHEFFSGRQIFEGSQPLAQAYAGHQFGHFNILGDGRAHLLGEHVTEEGKRFDIQLKGSGPTRFSRRGDGLAALKPMLREYLISEAMFALKIPTTRSLAVVSSGDSVRRETLLPGGILTRVASSHIRVGTFEFAAAQDASRESTRYTQEIADYTLKRHYPHLLAQPEPYFELLKEVIERQVSLITQWMLVGFIHGVMNTDNMTLSGETIDYGPCAFMDHYSLSTVFSSIDTRGRYAYGQQPAMAQWNLTRLAEALLPLLGPNQEEAIQKAKTALEGFGESLQRHWLAGMRKKLGLVHSSESDMGLMTELLELMAKNRADYTNTFTALSNHKLFNEEIFEDADFLAWHKRWLALNPDSELMKANNPAVIPRNHLVEKALSDVTEDSVGPFFEKFLSVLQNPFAEPGDSNLFTQPPLDGGEGYKTFCGT